MVNPTQAFAAIHKKQQLIVEAYMVKGEQSSSPNSPAYNLRFTNGDLNGKSPAEVLIERGDGGLNILREEYRNLQQDLRAHPDHFEIKDMMDAITEASNLYKSGSLNKTDETPTPLLIYHPNFARFKFAIINDGTAVTANLRPSAIPVIVARNRWAFDQYMSYQYYHNESNDDLKSTNLAAFTVRFNAGSLKGKSPADVILAKSEDGIQELREQYKFLQKNLEKYPKNQNLMNAIQEAVKLHQDGKLTEMSKQVASAPNTKPILIYSMELRGNHRKVREDGKSPVFDMRIEYHLDKTNPVSLEIARYWAPIIQNNDGTLNVQASQKSDVIRNSINLSVEEWEDCLYTMQSRMRMFENDNAHAAFELADKLSWKPSEEKH